MRTRSPLPESNHIICKFPLSWQNPLDRGSDTHEGVLTTGWQPGDGAMTTIGITGSEGLIGTALTKALLDRGIVVRRLDLRVPIGQPGRGDVLDRESVEMLARNCDGVVHLAAVSRVIWGEHDPRLCWDTNVIGTQNVIEACIAHRRRPWLLLASSREVYGQASSLPVSEDAPLAPLNVYGRSKVEAEQRLEAARGRGLSTAVLRFSNVYGDIQDHADRVIPAFALASALGETLRIDGPDHLFDFTHLADTVRGVLAVMERLSQGAQLPPIQLVTGEGTSLRQLADLAVTAGCGRSRIVYAPPRSYDVARFVGDPSLAQRLLGFRTQISLTQGLAALVAAFSERERQSTCRLV